MNLNQTINKASQILKSINIQTHQLDAEIILSNIMGVEREFLLVNNNFNLPKKLINEYLLPVFSLTLSILVTNTF